VGEVFDNVAGGDRESNDDEQEEETQRESKEHQILVEAYTSDPHRFPQGSTAAARERVAALNQR
jgi:hypothetical protein